MQFQFNGVRVREHGAAGRQATDVFRRRERFSTETLMVSHKRYRTARLFPCRVNCRYLRTISSGCCTNAAHSAHGDPSPTACANRPSTRRGPSQVSGRPPGEVPCGKGGFRRGRDCAAWLGLVPVQKSTGGKQVLGRTSKMGQRDIRRLLIIGAMTRIRWAVRNGAPRGSWLEQMLAR